jgi:hypothetical protein
MIRFYVLLCVLGTLLPYAAFVSWLIEHGVDIPLLLNSIIASKIGLFAWLDVVVSSVVLIAYILATGRRDSVPYWWTAIIGTLTVGVSLGLPLYLLLRELRGSAKATSLKSVG